MLAPLAFVVAVLLAWQNSGEWRDLPVASPVVQAFVRDALQERMDADAVPDFNLWARSRRVALRAEMPSAGLRLTEDALPHREGGEFYLISTAAAQAQADQTGQDVVFVIVDSPEIKGDAASLKIGTDVVIHRDPSRQIFKMCCCDGVAVFNKVDAKWVFARWANGIICR